MGKNKDIYYTNENVVTIILLLTKYASNPFLSLYLKFVLDNLTNEPYVVSDYGVSARKKLAYV